MDQPANRPRGAGSLTAALAVAALFTLVGAGVAYFVGGRVSEGGNLPLSIVVGLLVGLPVAWRVYRGGWKAAGTDG